MTKKREDLRQLYKCGFIVGTEQAPRHPVQIRSQYRIGTEQSPRNPDYIRSRYRMAVVKAYDIIRGSMSSALSYRNRTKSLNRTHPHSFPSYVISMSITTIHNHTGVSSSTRNTRSVLVATNRQNVMRTNSFMRVEMLKLDLSFVTCHCLDNIYIIFAFPMRQPQIEENICIQYLKHSHA